jgi:electron transfer flavoprotein alpha subunit
MSILIVTESRAGQLAAEAGSLVTAAAQLGGGAVMLVIGEGAESAARSAASFANVTRVLWAEDARWLAETIAPLVVTHSASCSHLLFAANSLGKDVMPRVAALLDVQPLSDVIRIESADTFLRPFYAGNALATVQMRDAVKVMTLRPTAFDAATPTGGNASVEAVSLPSPPAHKRFVKMEATVSARPELTSARVVVSGGRGVGSAENFRIIEALADRLGAAVGASRAAVDAGYVPNDYQVGQTGKIVAPELYIAVGISGAIQHLAGMKDSKVIVAINKDENAPIFEVADYGLVADLFEAVPALTKALG